MLTKDNVINSDEAIEPDDALRGAFDSLKRHFTSPPVIALPMGKRAYMIDCVVSQYAVGVVLPQQQNEKNAKEYATIGYFSKTLSKKQWEYFATKKEYLVVVSGLLTMGPYREGANLKVRTDLYIKWMIISIDQTGRVMIWILRWMEFDYEPF